MANKINTSSPLNTSANSSFGGISSQEKKTIQDASRRILDLSATNDQVIDSVWSSLQDGKVSEIGMAVVQQALNRRAQLSSFLSNMLKTLHETAMGLIRNLRLN